MVITTTTTTTTTTTHPASGSTTSTVQVDQKKAEKAATKIEKAAEKELVKVKHTANHAHAGVGLVPPPPPETPTILPNGQFIPGLMGSMSPETMSPAALAQRRKDIVAQLNSAKKLLADKQQRSAEYKGKIQQFESLYSEGVISRKELENTKKEAESTTAELNEAKTQVAALQNTLNRIDDRLKPKAVASSAKKKKTKSKPKQTALAKPASTATITTTDKTAQQPKVLGAKDPSQPNTQSDNPNKDAAMVTGSQTPAVQAGSK